MAANSVNDRGYGKPVAEVNVQINRKPLTREIDDDTDAELMASITGAHDGDSPKDGRFHWLTA